MKVSPLERWSFDTTTWSLPLRRFRCTQCHWSLSDKFNRGSPSMIFPIQRIDLVNRCDCEFAIDITFKITEYPIQNYRVSHSSHILYHIQKIKFKITSSISFSFAHSVSHSTSTQYHNYREILHSFTIQGNHFYVLYSAIFESFSLIQVMKQARLWCSSVTRDPRSPDNTFWGQHLWLYTLSHSNHHGPCIPIVSW